MKTHNHCIWRLIRTLAAAILSGMALSGCYVVPIGTGADGSPHYVYSAVPPVVATSPTAPHVHAPHYVHSGASPQPATLAVRLYPQNDIANQHGVLTGSVANMMNGKGRFTFNYQGDTLVGEATRVSGEERRGVASAHGTRGAFASCEYQMNTPRQGAGTCSFSDGARYQVHIGG